MYTETFVSFHPPTLLGFEGGLEGFEDLDFDLGFG